jgi:putative membrane protein insertion efficiency factor
MKKTLLKIVRIYQQFISPIFGPHCRFYPTCSEYSFQAIEKKGVFKGVALSIWRVLRCNPLNKGGIDIP